MTDELPTNLNLDQILNSKQAATFTGNSLPHWRRLYQTGKAPKPIKIGERKLGWRARALVDWVDSRADTRAKEVA